MKQIFAYPVMAFVFAAPLHADEPPSLMERGAQLFFEGLMQEMSPALESLADLMEETGPALEEFVTQMGPKLREVLTEVEDWTVYEAPEVLPNGDIIIRRKPPETPPAERRKPEPEAPQIDL